MFGFFERFSASRLIIQSFASGGVLLRRGLDVGVDSSAGDVGVFGALVMF